MTCYTTSEKINKTLTFFKKGISTDTTQKNGKQENFSEMANCRNGLDCK